MHGTGAKDNKCNFLENNEINMHPTRERLLVSMIADVSRIRKGDSILFYLQQNATHEGMFFGTFKVEDIAFVADDGYLNDELEKNLTFRIKILPNKVYAKGISERECLDSLDGINHPSQMCWSLIYRKLKGNRGCTMITDFEYDCIVKKMEIKNNFQLLDSNHFDYCKSKNEIISIEKCYKYSGMQESINIKNRLLYKMKKHNAHEVHLQAYILQNIANIECLKVCDSKIRWIGNEVSCGVGMQSIDLYFVQETEQEIKLILCELKCEQPEEYIKYQLKKYVDWIKDYIVPTYNKPVVVYPTIVAPKPNQATKELLKSIENFLKFEDEKIAVGEIRYISFAEVNNDIIFKEEENE